MSRFVVLDPMHDMAAVLQTARMLRRAGGSEIVAALTYTISAVHDDDFYAGLAGQMAASPDIDRVYVKDPAGLLTPERARTLIPAVRARLGAAMPLELHSHCTIGLSPLTYLAAADLGVAALQVACGPLANGTSLPNAERVVANLRGTRAHSGHRRPAAGATWPATSPGWPRAESLPAGDAAGVRRVVPAASGGGRRHDHHAAPARRARAGDRFDAVHGRGQPGPRGTRLSDHGHARSRRWCAGRRCTT